MSEMTDRRLDELLEGYYAAEPYYQPVYHPERQTAAAVRPYIGYRTATVFSILLVSVISVALFLLFGRGDVKPPALEPNTVVVTREPTRVTETPSVYPTSAPTTAATKNNEIEAVKPSDLSHPQSDDPSAQKDDPVVISPTSGSSERPTQSEGGGSVPSVDPTSEQPTGVIDDEYREAPWISAEVDPDELSGDGRLYCVIAETGYDPNGDPQAFSDERLYYIETKFGRFEYPHKFTISESYYEKNLLFYTFYNSNGEVLLREPLK